MSYRLVSHCMYQKVFAPVQMNEKRNVRESNLWKILASKYIPTEEADQNINTSELKGTRFEADLIEAYKYLDGRTTFPDIKFQFNLLEFGRFYVVLDDVTHFNRYRAKTLKMDFYEQLKSFPLPKYRLYCRNFESECLKAATSGLLWTNAEAEKHFGHSQVSGDLGLSGSAGWKLNAIKDVAVDLIARKRKMRMLRLAVWDDMMIQNSLKRLNDLLMSPRIAETEAILKLVEKRLLGLYADDF